MFSLEVRTERLERRYDTTALAARELEPALKKFGAYLLKKARARYKAQGFTPLAESTLEKRAQKGLHQLERKLSRDVKRAVQRAGGGLAAIVAATSKSTQRRIAVLAEFQRRHRLKRGLAAEANGVSLTLKQQLSLAKRTVRAVQKAINRPILGSLAGTLVIEVENGAVTLASRTHEKWTESHNKGGQVGHGAVLPKRETIFIEDEDLEVLAEILKEHHLLPAFNEAAEGGAAAAGGA